MQQLIKELQSLEKSEINKIIEQRLKEFSAFSGKSNEEWFQELCFCILAANSKQKTAEAIEKALTHKKLLTMPQSDLAQFIRDNKHRFHNNKARYIVEARKYRDIKDLVSSKSELEARSFLIKNIKGLGFKEASHFLRNTGSTDLAILDRHIINYFADNNLIQKPKTLTPKLYLEIEEKFQNLAKQLNTSSAKLDLMIWYLKTGEVAK